MGDLVATPANYETVMSFLLRFVVQRLKTWKDSLQTDWRPSGLVGKVHPGKAGILGCTVNMHVTIILWLQNNYNI